MKLAKWKKGEGLIGKYTNYREKRGSSVTKELKIRISTILQTGLNVYIMILETKQNCFYSDMRLHISDYVCICMDVHSCNSQEIGVLILLSKWAFLLVKDQFFSN